MDSKGKEGEADRLVAAQPYKFESGWNLRKLMELPTHLVAAGDVEVLKTEALMNLDWLLSKLSATSYRQIMDDLDLIRNAFPGEEDINVLTEVLQLSQSSLEFDPTTLPCQILGRVTQASNSTSSLQLSSDLSTSYDKGR